MLLIFYLVLGVTLEVIPMSTYYISLKNISKKANSQKHF